MGKQTTPRPRNALGQYLVRPGATPRKRPDQPQPVDAWSGQGGGDVYRARRALNLATIDGLQRAFAKGGQKAIDKVMRQSPAIFLKMLVLLVPRELEVLQSSGVKAMTDEQIDAAIETIKGMIERRDAGMVDVTPALPPAPDESEEANSSNELEPLDR